MWYRNKVLLSVLCALRFKLESHIYDSWELHATCWTFYYFWRKLKFIYSENKRHEGKICTSHSCLGRSGKTFDTRLIENLSAAYSLTMPKLETGLMYRTNISEKGSLVSPGQTLLFGGYGNLETDNYLCPVNSDISSKDANGKFCRFTKWTACFPSPIALSKWRMMCKHDLEDEAFAATFKKIEIHDILGVMW